MENIKATHACKHERLILAALTAVVAAIVLATFRPVVSAQAISFDDSQYLFENPLFERPGLASAGTAFAEIFESSTVGGYYEPLSLVSLMIDVAMGGRSDDLRPFHRTNLVLHVLNTVLVIVLLYQLFGRPWPAALAGLLFGVHPLTVEPVAWVWERKTVLATFFALLCLIAYLRYARKPGWTVYIASLGALAMALLSKPTATPLPALLLLLDYWPLSRLSRRSILEKVPFFVLAGVSAVITVISTHRNAFVTVPGGHSLLHLPFKVCYLLMFYLGKLIWPADLNTVYLPPVPLSWMNPLICGTAASVFLLAILLVLSRRRSPVFLVGGLFFFLAISPTLGVIGYSGISASDRYVYLPFVGVLVILAWLLNRIWDASADRPRRAVSLAGIVAVILVLAVAEAAVARRYLACWRDSEALGQRMVSIAPASAVAQDYLATALHGRGKLDEAIERYRQSLLLNPIAPGVHSNLGRALVDKKDFDGAIVHCQEALRLWPAMDGAYNTIGVALAGQGKPEAAIDQYDLALKLKPRNINARYNKGLAFAELGRLDEAIEQYRIALQIDPRFGRAYRSLAAALGRNGRLDEAAEACRKALVVEPSVLDAQYTLGMIQAKLGKTDEAIKELRKYLQARPLSADAHYTVGFLLERQQRFDEARAEYSEVLRIDPTHSSAKQSLHMLAGQPAVLTTSQGE